MDGDLNTGTNTGGVVTLNRIVGLFADSVDTTGIDFVDWCDTNWFYGVRLGIAEGATGVVWNSGSPTNDRAVRRNNFWGLGIDSGGNTGTVALDMNLTSGNTIMDFFSSLASPATNLSISADTGSYWIQDNSINIGTESTLRNNMGIPYRHTANAASTSLTGTTNKTDLRTATIDANFMGATGGFRVSAFGTTAGTAGTKTIKLELGSNIIGTISIAKAATSEWIFEADVFKANASAQKVYVKGWEGTTSEIQDVLSLAEDTSNDLTIKITGQLGDSGDTITQAFWLVEALF